ncbi:hypothetical protein [Rhizobium sp. PP-CC-3G-465]|uniref:hypothetical protein n=1 Tax=Rhizobium sp. PP-CC-3G-465 TaxID=2135648 RepID=UPI001050BEE9|nr:hypothetical protein C8J33_10330 [Rhizobium sp. PP-CC-3G-465]
MSRKGSIIALAESRSRLVLDSVPAKGRKLQNLEQMRSVCRALVERSKPLSPTAALVSQEARNRVASFPSPQTIYNDYREMLGIWRKAYDDIMHIDALDPIPVDQLEAIDVSGLDTGTRFIVDELRQHVRELTQRCNALKQIIAENVRVPADDLPAEADRTIKLLSAWLERCAAGPFELDDLGLHVGRRILPSTTIMDAELFNMLRTLVADYRRGARARSA